MLLLGSASSRCLSTNTPQEPAWPWASTMAMGLCEEPRTSVEMQHLMHACMVLPSISP